MIKEKKILILSTIIYFFFIGFSFAQSDSIIVTIRGVGLKGEAFKVYYGSSLILTFKNSHLLYYTFKIPKDSNWKNESTIPIQIGRKGAFCFSYRNTGLTPLYEPGKQHLIIVRDRSLKNKYAFVYHWAKAIYNNEY